MTQGTARSAELPTARWIYVQKNLQVAENLPPLEAVLRRAAASGYNGVVLADYKLHILDRVPRHYFQNAEKFKAICKGLNLQIIPAVAPFGYSSGILAHDPNLAEGLPARDVPFVVRGDTAVPENQGKNLIPGDFEDRRGDTFLGWSFQDDPGRGTFADGENKRSGHTCLRVENPPGVRGTNRRVSKVLSVRPWTQFHASVWIRSEEFASAADVRMFAIGADGRTLAHTNLGVRQSQGWKQHHVVFNSLENREIRFYLGVWGCREGKLWLDDARLVEEPLVNLVRRPGCPLKVTDLTGNQNYEEGKDFAPLRDEQLGTVPYAGEYSVYHEPPRLRILPGSRIKDGQPLRLSYYHAVLVYDGQVACSLSEPKVFEVVEQQIRRVEELFHPRTYLLSHDEIRVANWSEPEMADGKSAGERLAENLKRCTAIVKKVSPRSRMFVWSDMFDPHHNARKAPYYLVRGDLTESWKGLPAEMGILNWNGGKAGESLQFFAGRGHSQIIAGYYDAPVARLDRWLDAARGVKGVQGLMYTTWRGDYSQLEAFAVRGWGGKPAASNGSRRN